MARQAVVLALVFLAIAGAVSSAQEPTSAPKAAPAMKGMKSSPASSPKASTPSSSSSVPPPKPSEERCPPPPPPRPHHRSTMKCSHLPLLLPRPKPPLTAPMLPDLLPSHSLILHQLRNLPAVTTSSTLAARRL
ncbi:hypothetical protein Syun_024348 [Stephania yunnanensis]|uniref:Uncharacterized protein n=1 Tax=Stephania yunnanensis TaxID=152371 RepID=A0AAP0NHH2_9MAGN